MPEGLQEAVVPLLRFTSKEAKHHLEPVLALGLALGVMNIQRR